MAKQTFTTGQVLTAAQMTSLQQTAMGGGSATTKTASYTLVAADAGTTVTMTSASATTITVNTSLFAAGDTVYIQNLGTGVSTITAGTATVNTSATLALAQYEGGQLYFVSTSASIFLKGDGAAAAAGGANFSLLNSGGTALSGVSTRTVSGISGQSTLVVLLEDASTNTASSEIIIRLNTDTGANYTNFGANLFSPSSYGAGSLEATTYAGVTGIYVGQMPGAASGAVCAGVTIIGCNAAGYKMFNSVGSGNAVSTFNQRADWAQGFYNGASTISSVSAVSQSGNFDAGKIYVYGSAV